MTDGRWTRDHGVMRLVHLAADRLDQTTIADTLHLLLEYERDIAEARSGLPNRAARAR